MVKMFPTENGEYLVKLYSPYLYGVLSFNHAQVLSEAADQVQQITWLNKHTLGWFAHDVTKNQTKKLSILLSFYFHEVLQYLNTFT